MEVVVAALILERPDFQLESRCEILGLSLSDAWGQWVAITWSSPYSPRLRSAVCLNSYVYERRRFLRGTRRVPLSDVRPFFTRDGIVVYLSRLRLRLLYKKKTFHFGKVAFLSEEILQEVDKLLSPRHFWVVRVKLLW